MFVSLLITLSSELTNFSTILQNKSLSFLTELTPELLKEYFDFIADEAQRFPYPSRRLVHDFLKLVASSLQPNLFLPLISSSKAMEEIEENGDEEWGLILSKVLLKANDLEIDISETSLSYTLINILKRDE